MPARWNQFLWNWQRSLLHANESPPVVEQNIDHAVHWLSHVLVAEAGFMGGFAEGSCVIRAFRVLRHDKEPKQVVRDIRDRDEHHGGNAIWPISL